MHGIVSMAAEELAREMRKREEQVVREPLQRRQELEAVTQCIRNCASRRRRRRRRQRRPRTLGWILPP
jgi:hypothetical protein